MRQDIDIDVGPEIKPPFDWDRLGGRIALWASGIAILAFFGSVIYYLYLIRGDSLRAGEQYYQQVIELNKSQAEIEGKLEVIIQQQIGK